MTDNKLTDEQIKKALECCIINDCDNCPLEDVKLFKDCLNNFLNQINRQKAEIEKKDIEIDILIRKKNDAYDENAELKAEIERLIEEKDNLIKTYKECILEVVKDLAEKLKAKKQRLFSEDDGMLWCVSVADIDEVLKEVSE